LLFDTESLPLDIGLQQMEVVKPHYQIPLHFKYLIVSVIVFFGEVVD